MITVSGNPVFPEVGGGAPSLFDIGFGLSRIPRFNGHTKIWYPVLSHTNTVANLVSWEYAAYAYLHDAGESIRGDTVTTWKTEAESISETILLQRISESVGLQWPWPDEAWVAVKRADSLALSAEAVVLGHADAMHPHFTAQRLEDGYDRALAQTLSELDRRPDNDFHRCTSAARRYQYDVEQSLRAVHHAVA